MEKSLYIRNGRPNRVVFHFNGVRYPLEHRGSRQDSVALPIEAANDQQISRWLQIGQLEKISQDSFMKLGARTVDILPNEYLKQNVRKPGGLNVPMTAAESDTARTLTQVEDRDVQNMVRENVSPKWAGDLMSTEEELESAEFANQQAQPSYPSKNRDDDVRRQLGY